jgi:hypothetical protein
VAPLIEDPRRVHLCDALPQARWSSASNSTGATISSDFAFSVLIAAPSGAPFRNVSFNQSLTATGGTIAKWPLSPMILSSRRCFRSSIEKSL